jgi:DNA-binding LacI/PurR family transcriptional regulator
LDASGRRNRHCEEGRDEAIQGTRGALQLINLSDPATATLCFNDVVAIGLTRALIVDQSPRFSVLAPPNF